MKVSASTKITMQVPLKFVSEDICFGVKNEGGMISKNKNEIELTCLAENLPEFIEVNVADLKLGNSIMQTGLILPEGVELSNALLTGQDQPVVSCTTTRASLEIEEDLKAKLQRRCCSDEDSKEEASEAAKESEEKFLMKKFLIAGLGNPEPDTLKLDTMLDLTLLQNSKKSGNWCEIKSIKSQLSSFVLMIQKYISRF